MEFFRNGDVHFKHDSYDYVSKKKKKKLELLVHSFQSGEKKKKIQCSVDKAPASQLRTFF